MRLPRGGTLRRCMPTRWPAGRGGSPSPRRWWYRPGGGGEGRSRARRGPRGGPASARVIRQPRRCRRCQRAPTSTMRLVLSHTQGVSRPHILLLDAAGPQNERNGEEKRENVRARERFHEADLQASERASGRGSFSRDGAYRRHRILARSLLIVPQTTEAAADNER